MREHIVLYTKKVFIRRNIPIKKAFDCPDLLGVAVFENNQKLSVTYVCSRTIVQVGKGRGTLKSETKELKEPSQFDLVLWELVQLVPQEKALIGDRALIWDRAPHF